MRILGDKGRRLKGKWETASEPLTTESRDSWDVVLEPIILLVLLFLTLTSWLTRELSLRISGMEKKRKFCSLGRCLFIP